MTKGGRVIKNVEYPPKHLASFQYTAVCPSKHDNFMTT